MDVRRLIGPDGLPELLDDRALAEAYAWTEGVRASMLTTLDGVVAGSDGRSGSLGGAADRTVYRLNRSLAEAIVVGAGTARTEAYGLPAEGQLLVLVSRRGELPERLAAEAVDRPGRVVLAAGSDADTSHAERVLGAEQVWRFDTPTVPPQPLRDRLLAAGRRRILHEGGPSLLAHWLAAGLVDELCLTVAPRLVGEGVRLMDGPVGDPRLRPLLLLESEGSLLGRWAVRVTAASRTGH
ncbi:hypothetical protein CGZ93_10125 [Enemella dayhoffiae]|uniref:Bacterial bifunctional deaminase-reductase C-terminal domain-containing protein n=1 Tax=Enemella dayhoffiae TaxID=2016507 RepID=A0A255H2T6_9ACTN|nr:dihydrofolate reductase family protein [Enemella dayhoffiae]OYO21646.1 hypothetical protein CGZ93_10125 [Enemella dayhoffiae]